ncbi:MAG: DUF4416 family protein [Deltaproteobacteria bacterium]
MKATNTPPAKLVVSLFTCEKPLFLDALKWLEEEFGPLDFLSELLAFDYTDYYKDEFGGGLKRKVASFENPVLPEGLADIKTFTNSLEEGFKNGPKRRINIDPGILTNHNFILATRKDFSHRVCLSQGVYADLTLIYSGGGFKDLEWTYPDYRDSRMKSILLEIRKRHVFKLKAGQGAPAGDAE